MTELANRISSRRKQLNMTQEQLAFTIQTNQRQISRYEHSGNNPTADVLMKLADALDTTTDWLLGRTDNPERPLRNESDLDTLEVEVVEMLRRQDMVTRQRVVNAIKALLLEPAGEH